MPMAMAASASPACRIAARCFACRTASGPGRSPTPAGLTDEALAPVFARAADLDFFILGTGASLGCAPESLRARFREVHISLDVMTTGPAVRTYNVMLMESRRVGAGLIAVD